MVPLSPIRMFCGFMSLYEAWELRANVDEGGIDESTRKKNQPMNDATGVQVFQSCHQLHRNGFHLEYEHHECYEYHEYHGHYALDTRHSRHLGLGEGAVVLQKREAKLEVELDKRRCTWRKRESDTSMISKSSPWAYSVTIQKTSSVSNHSRILIRELTQHVRDGVSTAVRDRFY